MLKLVLADALALFGLCAFFYGAFQLLRRQGGKNTSLWMIAGFVTVAGIMVDTTVLVYWSRAGHKLSALYLHNTLNAMIVLVWLYVAFKDGFFDRWK